MRHLLFASYCLLFCLAIWASSSPVAWAQTRTFQRTIDLGLDESATGVATVPAGSGGGYIISGYTDGGGAAGIDAFLLRLNPNGSTNWFQRYGGAGDQVARVVRRTNDGGYVFGGYSTNAAKTVRSIWVVKTDALGAIQWQRNYTNGPVSDIGSDGIIQTSDGGYAIVGHTSTTASATTYDTYVIRIDNTGGFLWSRRFPISTFALGDDDRAVTVAQLPNDNLFIAGNTQENSLDIFNMVLNNAGAVVGNIYRYNLGTSQSADRVASARLLPSGNILLGGSNNQNIATGGNDDHTIIEVNPSSALGIFNSFSAFGSPLAEQPACAVVSADPSRYLLAATSVVPGPGTIGQINILKTSPAGVVDWQNTYGTAASDSALAIAATPDSGGIVVGHSFGFTAGRDIYILKFDQFGNTRCLESPLNLSTVNPPSPPSAVNPIPQNLLANSTPAFTAANVLPLPTTVNPCCAGFSVDFNLPALVCIYTPTFFNNNSVAGTSPSYSWDVGNNGSIESTNQNLNFQFTNSGTIPVKLVVRNLAGCADSVVKNVIVNLQPVAKASNDTTICIGSTITISGQGSAPANVNYTWSVISGSFGSITSSPNLQNVTVQPLVTPTFYRLVVRNPVTTCLDTDTVQVNVNLPPVVDAGTDTVICRGNSYTMTPTSTGSIYAWTPLLNITGANTAAAVVTPPVSRMYYLRSTDANGCSTIDSVFIRVVRVTVGPTNATLCLGQSSATITATPSLPGNYTFDWTPNTDVIGPTNTNTLTVNPSVVRRYKVVMTRVGGCRDSDSVQVNIAPPPTADAGNDTAICDGFNLRLRASGGVSYQWDPSAGLAPLNVSNPTYNNPTVSKKFYVTVTDANGCTDRDSIDVTVNPLPTVDAGIDTLVCQGTCITLTPAVTGAISYRWTPALNLSNANIQNPQICPTITQKYIITVTSAGGCTARDSLIVIFDPKPTGIANPPVSTICRDDSIVINLTGTPGSTYRWTNLGNVFAEQLKVGPTDTIRYAIIPRRNQCDGDTIFAQVNVKPRPLAIFAATPFTCEGDTVDIQYLSTIVPGSTTTWNFGSNAQILSGSGYGPYRIVYNDTGLKVLGLRTEYIGCVDISPAIFVQVRPKPQVDAGPDVFYCQGSSGVLIQGSSFVAGTASPSCSYQWTPSLGLSNPFLPTPRASPLVNTKYTLRAICNSCRGKNIDSMTVFVLPRPVAQIDTFQLAFCAGSGGVRLPGRGSGGVGTLTYSWTPTTGLDSINSRRPKANPGFTTRYGLVTTDANGCVSDTAFILVTVNPLPSANAGPDRFICQGSNQGVNLQGTATGATFGSYNYRWSPSTGLSDVNVPNPFARPNVTTIYTLTVTANQTGCSSISTALDTVSTVTVNVVPVPIADAGPDQAICPNQQVRIGGTPLNCIPRCSFLWTPSAGLEPGGDTLPNPLASPTEGRTYFLRVSSAGCISNVDTVRVSVNPRPTVDIIRNAIDVCPGERTQLQTSIGGVTAGNFTYLWSPGIGLSDSTVQNPFVTPTATRLYYFIASVDGCPTSNRDSILVRVYPAPSITVVTPPDVCGNDADSIQLNVTIASTVTPYYIQWSPGNLVSDSTIAAPKVKVSESQKLYITVRTSNCVVRDSVEITVLPGIVAKIDLPGNKIGICARDSVVLNALGSIGSATITWSPATGLNRTTGPRVVARPATTTTYKLTVSEAGCTSSDTVRITVSPRPLANFSQSATQGCDTFLVSFVDSSSAGASSWEWDFGDNSPRVNIRSPQHVYTDAGSFRARLVVFAIGGCSDTAFSAVPLRITPELRVGFLSIPALPSVLRLPEAGVDLIDTTVGAVSWFYDLGDGTNSTSRELRHNYRQAGDYFISLRVTDINGCTGTTTKGPFRVEDPDLVIPEVFTPNGDGINDLWTVQYRGSSRWKAYLQDRWGQIVYTTSGVDRGWDGWLRGAEAPAGVYFYAIEIDGRTLKGSVTLIR
jgi:gliding motility-associated-like protein